MKIKTMPKGSVIAALDIGSSKIACFIARTIDDNGDYEVLGVGHQASAGVKNGIISDLDKAEGAIRQAVHAAENMAAESMKGYPLREVVVNVSGLYARSNWHSADLQVAGHEITDYDIKHTLVYAQDEAAREDSEIIHTIPMGYTIDGHSGIVDPVGMYGQNMLADIHMVSAETAMLKNIATCVGQSHLDINAFCLGSYASGLAVLIEDEMDLGATVVDMGAGLTSFAVFRGGHLIVSRSVPIGGQHVTNDIAKVLGTSISDAERLKILYGSAMASQTDESEMIDVPVLGENDYNAINHLPRSQLVGIIQPRLEEIFEMVRSGMEDLGLGSALSRRVVLTGGASQLSGMKDLAQYVLDQQVRIGKPVRISGLPDAVSGPAFATASGLLAYTMMRSMETPSVIIEETSGGSIWGRVKEWVRENW